MSDTTDTPLSGGEARPEQVLNMAEKIFSAVQPGVVFGEPVTNGNYTVITASEVVAGGGFGYGGGPVPQAASESGAPEGSTGARGQEPMGSGGGGGGGARGRPVAVIVIGPDGVKVKPVFDLTKIAIAGITAWGAMAATLARMRRTSQG